MRTLYLLYDETCAFCVRCADWLRRQPSFVELQCVPAGAPDTRRIFGAALRDGVKQELVAIADDGAIWRGPEAWLMSLWALEDWREWSLRLSKPSLLPLARSLFELVSTQRPAISRWLGARDDETVIRTLRSTGGDPEKPRCEDGACELDGAPEVEGPGALSAERATGRAASGSTPVTHRAPAALAEGAGLDALLARTNCAACGGRALAGRLLCSQCMRHAASAV